MNQNESYYINNWNYTNEIKSRLQLQEGILFPIPYKERDIWGKLRSIVMLIVGCIILFSIIFWENVFMELNTFPRVVIILLFIKVIFVDVDYWGPSEMELYFYDDRLEVYRNKVYRGKNLNRQEWEVMYYKDIKDCRYRTVSKKIEIYGIKHGEYREYRKDGTLKENLSYNKTTDSLINFYTRYMDVNMVISELQKFIPLRVDIRES